MDFNRPNSDFPLRERQFSGRSEWSHISVEQICAYMAPLARPSVNIHRRNLHRVCRTRCTNVIFVGMGVKNAGLHVSLITFPNKQTSFYKCEPLLDSAGARLRIFRLNDADFLRSFERRCSDTAPPVVGRICGACFLTCCSSKSLMPTQ